MSRRPYVLTVLSCLAGAGVTLFAATRVWSLEVEPRPGMTDLTEGRTGADIVPWMFGLALVAMAGTGALLAVHGWVRRVLGVLLALAGGGVVAGAATGLGDDVSSVSWPVLCILGGLLVIAGGLTALRLGHRWPGMSARYERPVRADRPESDGEVPVRAGEAGGGPAGDSRGGDGRAAGADSDERSPSTVDHRAAWDALDRGDDPTAR